MAERFSTNFGAKRNDDQKFRTFFAAKNENLRSNNDNFYQFRSDFKRPNDEDLVAQNSDFPPDFKLDENNLLASLNSLILGEEIPSPPPPPLHPALPS